MFSPEILKILKSKDLQKAVKEYEKLAKEMQVVLKILEENAQLYSGIHIENGEVKVCEVNDRTNYYNFMAEVLDSLERIEKRLEALEKKEE